MERIQQVQKRPTLTAIRQLLSLVFLAGALSACANNYVKREIAHKETPLVQAQQSIPDNQLLAVRVESFDVGALPEDPNLAKGLSPEIRNAESYFFAVHLKNTMQRSGHWGPVRVVPKDMRDGEVNVAGRILESDGEILKLEIRVEDAMGREWFTKEYSSVIDDKIYDKMRNQGLEAYQDLYNEIANDVAQHKQKLATENAEQIRKVAELRFGQDFAPKIYDGYLQETSSEPKKSDDGLSKLASLFSKPAHTSAPVRFQISRLPPDNDPLVERVNRIRAREDFLVDTLDQQYDTLATRLSPAYLQWRRARLQEIYAIRESDRLENQKQGEAVAIAFLGALAGAAVGSQRNCYSCRTAGAAVAATAIAVAANHAIQASNKAKADTDMRKLALEELGRSLMTDVQPTVIEVEGQTVELKGTVEQKMVQWSALLEELREKEIGPIVSIEPAAGS